MELQLCFLLTTCYLLTSFILYSQLYSLLTALFFTQTFFLSHNFILFTRDAFWKLQHHVLASASALGGATGAADAIAAFRRFLIGTKNNHCLCRYLMSICVIFKLLTFIECTGIFQVPRLLYRWLYWLNYIAALRRLLEMLPTGVDHQTDSCMYN